MPRGVSYAIIIYSIFRSRNCQYSSRRILLSLYCTNTVCFYFKVFPFKKGADLRDRDLNYYHVTQADEYFIVGPNVIFETVPSVIPPEYTIIKLQVGNVFLLYS